MSAVFAGTVITWLVTTPAVHDAAVAVGATGVTVRQEAAGAVSVKVADVRAAFTTHPAGAFNRM